MAEDGASSEITVRGILLGAAITVVFMMANLYLGLKTGMTFASSIPAALISMSALRLFGARSILEDNIVQTQASAAGTLCNVILVLPGLVLISFWNDFPLWQTSAICLLAGLLGVVFSVPLRRAMVVDTDLPYPEGAAAAEVLRAGHEKGGGDGMRVLLIGTSVAACFNLLSTGLRLLPSQLTFSTALGHAVFRASGGFSLALIGVGYLVRIGACLALLIGAVIAWGIAVPILSTVSPVGGDAGHAAEVIWAGKVRLMGAGVIATGAVWTVVTLIAPILKVFTAPAKGGRDRQKRDVPIVWVLVFGSMLSALSAAFIAVFLLAAPVAIPLFISVVALTLFVVVFGFVMAAACGYMAGLLGSSSSPISGFGILTTMVIATALGLFSSQGAAPAQSRFIIALTIFLAAFIVTISSIANDNLQDLKTGQLVGATPWKQQVALAIGVSVGAVTIAPILKLLYHAYGFAGSFPHAGMDPQNAMPAPQAALMTQIATGIVEHHIDWSMIGIGAAVGVAFLGLEAILKRKAFSLPALTVGIGIYLPCEVVLTIAAGGVLGWILELRTSHRSKEDIESARTRGVLTSSGFLVGESLVGIVIAFADTIAGRSGSLNLSHGSASNGQMVFGCFLFLVALVPLVIAAAPSLQAEKCLTAR